MQKQYKVIENFDDGKIQAKKGDLYKGDNAEQLLKEKLIAPLSDDKEKAPPVGDDDPDAGAEVTGEDELADLDAMTKAQIQEMLTEKGIVFPLKATKAQLIELLPTE